LSFSLAGAHSPGPHSRMDDKLAKAAAAIASAKRIVVFSGAGISAESGISTFRAPDIGMYARTT